MNVTVCEYHLIIVVFIYSIRMCTCHYESLFKGLKWNKSYQSKLVSGKEQGPTSGEVVLLSKMETLKNHRN
jgi:hypothetical protein